MRILVVEDDSVLREAIVALLTEEKYLVDEAAAGDEGLYLAEQGIYDLVVLDIMLPEISGIDIVRSLRSESITTPILLLTARDSIDDRVVGLESGADDYLVKPFAQRELLARIRAQIRRKGNQGLDGEPTYGKIMLNRRERDGFIDNRPLGLSTKEYDVLEFFILNREQVVNREQIFDRIWGFDSDTTISIVDLYVHYLRKKLAAFGVDTYIRTIRGAGFMLKEQ